MSGRLGEADIVWGWLAMIPGFLRAVALGEQLATARLGFFTVPYYAADDLANNINLLRLVPHR